MTDSPHVIIVGAGFAGLSAVGKLRKAGCMVTVIDKNLYSTFQPLLYQVATGGLNPGDVSYAVGGFTSRRRSRYVRGELAGIDAAEQRVRDAVPIAELIYLEPDVYQEGRADLTALAREIMYNPNWPMDAAQKLGVDAPFGLVPPPQAYWLAKRAQSVKSVVPSTYSKGMNTP